MNYEQLSDFEINKAVAEALGYDSPSTEGAGDKILIHNHGMPTRGVIDNYDPCNSPSDAWPIIVENRIALIPAFGIWDASKGDFKHNRRNFQVQNANPLRAAMIVFLMLAASAGEDNE